MSLKEVMAKNAYYKEIRNIILYYRSAHFECSSCLCNKEGICLESGMRYNIPLLIQFIIYLNEFLYNRF
jgi:hypothetical protein